MRRVLVSMILLLAMISVSACSQLAGRNDGMEEITVEMKETTLVEAGRTQAEDSANQESYDSVFPWHEPYGSGIGAKPGRVVWSYNPQSVDWDGERVS